MELVVGCQVEEAFLIKTNGVCYAHIGKKDDVTSEDLKSSLFIAFEIGICESFKNNKIKYIVLDDGKRVMFDRCEANGVNFNIITVISRKKFLVNNLKFKIKKFIDYLKRSKNHVFLDAYTHETEKKSAVDSEISKQMQSIFLKNQH